MAQQKIQLRKLRDFGENFSDTFQFIRQEFKPLLTTFSLVAGIFILINAILTGIFQKSAFGFLDQFQKGILTKEPDFSSIISPMYFVTIGFMLVTITAMRTVIAVYMKYYDEHNESPTVTAVWTGFIKYFFKAFIFSFPQYLLIAVGFVFCLFPGFYFMIVFAPFLFVIVNEDLSFSESFSRCFDLIKENFWISLAIYLIAYIIFSISSSIVGFALGLLFGAGSYFTTKEWSTTAGIFMSIVNIVQYLFYIIFFVSVGLNYYNLVEAKDGTGLAKRLENLGGNINPNTNIEEQY